MRRREGVFGKPFLCVCVTTPNLAQSLRMLVVVSQRGVHLRERHAELVGYVGRGVVTFNDQFVDMEYTDAGSFYARVSTQHIIGAHDVSHRIAVR
jgi:hypothetical protein